jgi:hypothetical protein
LVGPASIFAPAHCTRVAGFARDHIPHGIRLIDGITEHIRNHPIPVFLVAMPADKVVRGLTRKGCPGRDEACPGSAGYDS